MLLYQAEIRINAGIEETDGPMSWEIWKGVRQSIYAIIFDLNHRMFMLEKQKGENAKVVEDAKYLQGIFVFY
jgi:hypothetical protein